MVKMFCVYPDNNNAALSLCTAGVSNAVPYDDRDRTTVLKRKTSEFCYVVSGKGCVICNNKKYTLKAGDVYFLPRSSASETFSDSNDPWLTAWINVFGDLIPDIMSAYKLIKKVQFSDAGCYPLFKQLLAICRDQSLTLQEKNFKTSLLMHEMIQLLAVLPDTPSDSPQHNDAEIIKTYIDNHIYQNTKTSDLANLVHLSESQTIRMFKQAYGMTPHNYLLSMRMKSAQQLLEQTNLSIKEIAYNLGFSDEHYFSHLFKEKIGKNPTSYRKAISIENT